MFRSLESKDRTNLEKLLSRIQVFNEEDRNLAMELVDIALNNSAQTEYQFLLVFEDANKVIGYACYGPTPLTEGTYDLYWIAVDPDFAGKGIGSQLLARVEEMIASNKGRMVIIETSSDPNYESTRQFYLKNRYNLVETIKDFFRIGEDRVTYIKTLR